MCVYMAQISLFYISLLSVLGSCPWVVCHRAASSFASQVSLWAHFCCLMVPGEIQSLQVFYRDVLVVWHSLKPAHGLLLHMLFLCSFVGAFSFQRGKICQNRWEGRMFFQPFNMSTSLCEGVCTGEGHQDLSLWPRGPKVELEASEVLPGSLRLGGLSVHQVKPPLDKGGLLTLGEKEFSKRSDSVGKEGIH